MQLDREEGGRSSGGGHALTVEQASGLFQPAQARRLCHQSSPASRRWGNHHILVSWSRIAGLRGNLTNVSPYGIIVTSPPANPSPAITQLKQELAQLQQTVRLMEERRQQAIEQRRRRLAIIGGSLSMLFHIALLTYLALMFRGGTGGGNAAAGTTYELAILNQEELSELESVSFDSVETGAVTSEQPSIETQALTAANPSPASLGTSAATAPTLGGDGGGSGGGSGGDGFGMGGGSGGGGGTSFFGISSKGTRIAYIIDISASMAENNKLEIAKAEMIRSLEALPDYASFYVVLFSYNHTLPPMQKDWMKARKAIVSQFAAWLADVGPGGGTAPRSSFLQIFALELRPDVIYFLTDGGFNDITVEEITELNRRGKRASINTIQFGDRSNEELLRQIAKANGGIYRFAPTGGG